MLLDAKAIKQFISENYPDVTSQILDADHLGADCPKCKRGVALQVTQINASTVKNKQGFSQVSLFSHSMCF
jgi:hypothetical protein